MTRKRQPVSMAFRRDVVDTDIRVSPAHTPSTSLSERAKYICLLQMSNRQLRLLETGHMSELDTLISEKRALIESLSDSYELGAADPHLCCFVERIKESERLTRSVLSLRLLQS